MKTIPYRAKTEIKTANTEYREFRSADKKYLMDKLREIIELADGCINAPEQYLKTIGIKMKTPNKNIPRMGKINQSKMNSIYSAAEGIVDNIQNGTQEDFSNHTCKITEASFKELKNIFNDWELVEFVEVDELPKHAPVHDPIETKTTLSDLFDTQIYEVTVRRKK